MKDVKQKGEIMAMVTDLPYPQAREKIIAWGRREGYKFLAFVDDPQSPNAKRVLLAKDATRNYLLVFNLTLRESVVRGQVDLELGDAQIVQLYLQTLQEQPNWLKL